MSLHLLKTITPPQKNTEFSMENAAVTVATKHQKISEHIIKHVFIQDDLMNTFFKCQPVSQNVATKSLVCLFLSIENPFFICCIFILIPACVEAATTLMTLVRLAFTSMTGI